MRISGMAVDCAVGWIGLDWIGLDWIGQTIRRAWVEGSGFFLRSLLDFPVQLTGRGLYEMEFRKSHILTEQSNGE